MILHEGHRRLRLLFQNSIPCCEIVQTETILIAHRLEHFTQRKIECIHWIGIGEICKVYPILDRSSVVPKLGDAIGHEGFSITHVAILLNCSDRVGAITFYEIIAETIEANFFDQPARYLE